MSRRRIVVNEVTSPALVMGSAQSEATVDAAAVESAGLQLARRRSGGGAVLLIPGEHLWFDVVVPAGDPLHDPDVERATWWLGTAIREAIRDVGAPDRSVDGDLTMHRRGVSDRALGRVACFAASGPGEVLLGTRKLVGISQRRSREGERFQCVLHRRWDPSMTSSLLVVTDPVALRAALSAVATSGEAGVEDLAALMDAVRVRLEQLIQT